MLLTIVELNKLWDKEKESYRTQEEGSGVQKFVRELLKSPDIFNLTEGRLSSKIVERKNEFIHETKKEGRQADFVIFIDSEIIIPVEVERYGNIKAGEKQIFNYQRDWQKKYGILTDGQTWRFYNNNIPLKEFPLKDIFNKTKLFLEYWYEYIKPENYYLQFFEKVGQLEIFEEDISVDTKKINFFQDYTSLIQSFKNKLDVKGYFDKIGEKESEKKAIEITYAYIIQFILYKTLVDNDFEHFGRDFKQRIERIYKDLKNKNYSDVLTAIKAISDKISRNVYRPFSEEQEFINRKLESIILKPQHQLLDVTPWLDIFIFIKSYSFTNVRNEIFGYIYENYLKDLYTDEKRGQYFTDPSVVDFMVEQIGYTPTEISKRLKKDVDSISLIDPSCGSGTFLYSAVRNIIEALPNGSLDSSNKIEQLVNNNIYGLDIEEFPLYLAEMSIIMRMLPLIINEKYNNPIEKKIKVFKTRDSIAEFLDTALRNTLSDVNIEYHKNKSQLSLFTKQLNLGYESYVRDEDDLKEMKKSLEDQLQPRINRYRFDFVIGNPPYVSYNECSSQGLLFFESIKNKKNDVKLNNVYGMNLHSVPNNPKRYRPNPNLWAFFIALGLALLKDGGKLCYIIPQTMLTNTDFDVVRYHLAKFTTVEKIITFSGKMFIGRGIKQNKPVPTSSLIFVVTRKPPAPLHQVEIIHYKDPNDEIQTCLFNISKGRKILKNKILQSKLLQNIDNWNFTRLGNELIEFFEYYKLNSEPITIYSEHVWAKQYFKSNFYFDGGFSIDEKMFLSNPLEGYLNYKSPRLNDEYWTIKEFNGYWPDIRKPGEKMFIALRQGNQGYNFLDNRHKIIWSYNNTTRFFYCDENIIWARNKMLGISSNNKDEILYLFSLLNSKITNIYFKNVVKVENEETRTILVSLQTVKDQIRVPKITSYNQNIKDEIIKITEDILKLDEVKLSDLVDFSDVLIQKFDTCYMDGKYLIIRKDSKDYKCKIKSNAQLVEEIVKKLKNRELFSDTGKISLSELKTLPTIDRSKQEVLKDYVDDLFFALFFGILVREVDFKNVKKVKDYCKKNKFYTLTERT